MTTLEQIIFHARRLPEELQTEVLNFVEYLEKKSSHRLEMGADDIVRLLKDPKQKTERGKRMVAILEDAAAQNLFTSIKDPSTWQREARKDRPLPGRE